MKTFLTFDDNGLDTDDSLNARLRSRLIRQGELKMIGAIACMHPAKERAELLGKIYGIEKTPVPVAVGTSFNSSRTPKDYEFDLHWHDSKKHSVPLDFVVDRFFMSGTKSISLVVCSGMIDLWKLIEKYPTAVENEVKEIYIMGGASWGDNKMVADLTASNHKFCQDEIDCQLIYDWFIDRGIPVRVLSRHAAYAVDLPKDLYASLDGLVGEYLTRVHRASIQEFWNYFSSNPIDHRQNRFAFAINFCRMEDLPILTGEDPWEYIKGTRAYDPLTTLYAVYPELFNPSCRTIRGVKCEIVGLSKDDPGMEHPAAVADKLIELVK